MYIDKLDDIVSEYNNTYHRTIKIKPIDVTNDSFPEYNEESNERDPKFKVGDHVRIPNTKTFLLGTIHSKLVRRDFCCQKNKKYCTLDLYN